MVTVHIQGIDINHRDLSQSYVTEDAELIEGEEILNTEFQKDEQYFRKTEHPFSDDELIAIANRELIYNQFTPIQKQWLNRENKRFEEGVYAYIDGELTYIPGAYYCYVNYWTLEHGEKPEYREDDRVFFLFHEYLRLETIILAITRLKGRRQGATSIGMFFMWFIAGRKEHKLCGTTSFNDTACQDNFQKMFMYGFKALLPCFQADFDSDSDNFIRFVKPIEKKKKGVLAVKREGLNSYCDYKSNVINSYDSGRQSYNVPDEGGKRGKVDINSYFSRLYKTFLIGVNKVGFGYLPTTVGAKQEGGENYKLFYNNADQYKYGLNTPNRCVRYFVPATHCYAGCIDKFGRSVIDDPKEPMMGNDGKWITEGSKTIILRERKRIEEAIAAGISKPEQLMEHRRDYPLDEYDAFSFETGVCEFNEENFIKQIKYLEDNLDIAYWRQVRIDEKTDEKGKIIIDFVDDKNGTVWLKEKPNEPNKYKDAFGLLYPENNLMYQIGVDNYRGGFALNGSDGVIVVFKKSCIIDGVETGLYPVCIMIDRPRMIGLFNREVFKLCLWYGCKVNFEVDAGSFYYENFFEWRALKFLDWEPARDPTKQKKVIKPGTESANIFQLGKQLEVAKLYFDGNGIDCYNGNVHRVTFIPLLKVGLEYIHANREPYHLMVAFMMAILPVLNFGTKTKAAPSTTTKPVLPTYKLKIRQ